MLVRMFALWVIKREATACLHGTQIPVHSNTYTHHFDPETKYNFQFSDAKKRKRNEVLDDFIRIKYSS